MEPSKTLIYKFDNPLVKAKIIKRPSASCKTPYVADTILEEEIPSELQTALLAHTPALGCCGLTDKGSTVMMSEKTNPKTCSHCVELSVFEEKGQHIVVGCNPKMAEHLVEKCIQSNVIDSLRNVKTYAREKTFLNSRFDFWGIDSNDCEFILEVKNVPLATYEDVTTKELKNMDFTEREYDSKIAYFPDGYRKKKGDVVSPRALKHIQELEKLKEEKGDKLRAIICFMIQRSDISCFQASNLDMTYKKALYKAHLNGVEILPLVVEWNQLGEAYFIHKDLQIFFT